MKVRLSSLRKLGFKTLASKMEEAFTKELSKKLAVYFKQLNLEYKITFWPQRKKIKIEMTPLNSINYTYLITLVESNFMIVNKKPDEELLYKVSNTLELEKLAHNIGDLIKQHYSDAKKKSVRVVVKVRRK